jgi:membrane-bound metal-dependent hydrolase YbcI (DUF457 family)
VGHALAGMAAAWAVDVLPGRRAWPVAAPSTRVVRREGYALTLVVAALGAAPDLDLFLAQHRAITHSVGVVAAVFIVAAVVTGQVTRKAQSAKGKVQSDFKVESGSESQRETFRVERVLRIAVICAAAYGSHLLLDWLAVDRRAPYGLQLLWPFSDGWYISGLDVFPQTERRNLLSLETFRINLRAISFETAVMLPVLCLVWLVHVKTATGLPAEAARRHHAP